MVAQLPIVGIDFDDVLVPTAEVLIGKAHHAFYTALRRVTRCVSAGVLHQWLEQYGWWFQTTYERRLLDPAQLQTLPLMRGAAAVLEELAQRYRLVLLVHRPEIQRGNVDRLLDERGVFPFFSRVRVFGPSRYHDSADIGIVLEEVAYYLTNGWHPLPRVAPRRVLFWANPWVSQPRVVRSWREVPYALGGYSVLDDGSRI